MSQKSNTSESAPSYQFAKIGLKIINHDSVNRPLIGIQALLTNRGEGPAYQAIRGQLSKEISKDSLWSCAGKKSIIKASSVELSQVGFLVIARQPRQKSFSSVRLSILGWKRNWIRLTLLSLHQKIKAMSKLKYQRHFLLAIHQSSFFLKKGVVEQDSRIQLSGQKEEG